MAFNRATARAMASVPVSPFGTARAGTWWSVKGGAKLETQLGFAGQPRASPPARRGAVSGRAPVQPARMNAQKIERIVSRGIGPDWLHGDRSQVKQVADVR